MRTDVNACDFTRGCTDTVTESALKVDSPRKVHSRTGESNLRRQRAGPMLYQLSYISTPRVGCVALDLVGLDLVTLDFVGLRLVVLGLVGLKIEWSQTQWVHPSKTLQQSKR